MSLGNEIIPIVDENDTIIMYKMRKDVELDEIYRVSSIILKDGKGRILLAQRGFHKRNAPGSWSVSVAGTVEKGKTYEENIEKELFEELGINIIGKNLLKALEKHNFFE